MRWLVTYRAIWHRGERQYCPKGSNLILMKPSAATNWASVIDVDPAEWAAALAEDLRVFRLFADHDQIAVEIVQIYSIIPLDREALSHRGDFGALLTSTSATPELWPVH
jgi:hypothetical protein